MAGSSNVNDGPIGTRANHTIVSPSVSASTAQPPNWVMSGHVISPGVPANTRADPVVDQRHRQVALRAAVGTEREPGLLGLEDDRDQVGARA